MYAFLKYLMTEPLIVNQTVPKSAAQISEQEDIEATQISESGNSELENDSL